MTLELPAKTCRANRLWTLWEPLRASHNAHRRDDEEELHTPLRWTLLSADHEFAQDFQMVEGKGDAAEPMVSYANPPRLVTSVT